MQLNTGIDYLMGLPLDCLIELMKEVAEVVDDRKRIQAGNKNRRYH